MSCAAADDCRRSPSVREALRRRESRLASGEVRLASRPASTGCTTLVEALTGKRPQAHCRPKRSKPANPRRHCMTHADLGRAGSVESTCTQLGPLPSSAPPAAMAGSGAAPAPPACDPCLPQTMQPPGSCGSDESLQTSLDAALLQVPGSAGGAASTPAAPSAREAPPRQQPAAAELHPTLPPAFLADLEAANACVQRLPLPGEFAGPGSGVPAGLPPYSASRATLPP